MTPQIEPNLRLNALHGLDEYAPQTQPSLQPPGPPDWPRLPSVVGLDMNQPEDRVALVLGRAPKFSDLRGAFSSIFERVGLDALANKIAKKNFIVVEGPLDLAPRNIISLIWPGDNGENVTKPCRVPKGMFIPEGELMTLCLVNGILEQIERRDNMEIIGARKVIEIDER